MMSVSADTRENIEKLSNENDNKTILKHHVSISIFKVYYIHDKLILINS